MPLDPLKRVVGAFAVLSLTLPTGAAGATKAPPEAFAIGRDANGEPCQIARAWRDSRLPNPFDRAWSITCRGVTAARAQGWLLAIRNGRPASDKDCGAASPVTLPGVGTVSAQRCIDDRLGLPVVRLQVKREGLVMTGAALPTALGPLEKAMQAVAAGAAPASADAVVTPVTKAAALAAPPAAARPTAASDEVDPATLLQNGIALNHRGQYIDASRLLNDVLSRLDESTPPLTRAEAELEAGLADSNIRQFDAAVDHFDRADALLANQPAVDRVAFLRAKQSTYRGQDAINRRQFGEALKLLAQGDTSGDPLRDPVTLSALNQPPAGSGVRAALTGTSTFELSRLLLEAQRSWARSVSALSLGDVAGARRALADGVASVDQLQRSVAPDSIMALKARMQRQVGRLASRSGDLPGAIHAFDCALATLQNVPVASPGTCPLEMPVRGRAAALRRPSSSPASGGPMIAETEFERAALLARAPGVPQARVVSDFAAAADTMIASGASGNGVPAALEVYLDLLARADAAAPSAETEERFFRALQTVGEPSVARQMAQLQRIVAADGPLAAKVRDRAELERTVIRLRYEIASAPAADVKSLEADRLEAESRLAAIDAALAGDERFRATDDAPATIAEMRAALRPAEVYLKVLPLRTRNYGIVIGRDRTYIYALAASSADLDAIAARVRSSIRDDSGYLPPFSVAAAYALFDLITGPSRPAVLAARALVVDPSGPLMNLPAGVLVRNLDSVKRYEITRKTALNDLSQVDFLAGRAEITGALSPRSFLIARSLAPSRAPSPFIGFGENAPATAIGAAATTRIRFGTGCDISYADLAAVMNANQPIPATEIRLAADALGVPSAPEVTGAAFSDRTVLADSASGELARFQVLLFATHGLPETRSGCLRVPPALVTTLAPPAAGVAASDGLLSFGEIASLRLDANLVMLSACETAAGVSTVGGRLGGQDESGATLDGLVRAFITANARAVLATYWKVPDSAGSDQFVQTFFARGRGESIGAALRDAQAQAMRRPDTSHPYYWGAYFLVGDASKTMLSPSSNRVASR